MEKTVGMRIRECRVRMGITQEELALKLFVKKSTISAYENNKTDIKCSMLIDIARTLNVSSSYLLEGTVNKTHGAAMMLIW